MVKPPTAPQSLTTVGGTPAPASIRAVVAASLGAGALVAVPAGVTSRAEPLGTSFVITTISPALGMTSEVGSGEFATLESGKGIEELLGCGVEPSE
jgi:hypothetical protein